MCNLKYIFILFIISFSYAKPHWVWFADKGIEPGSIEESIALREAEKSLSDRCISRRIKARGIDNIVDYEDIPPPEEYITEILQTGAEIRMISKWLNAVSVSATADELDRIRSLPFVDKISPVASREFSPEPSGYRITTESDYYGNSLIQNEMVRANFAHRAGINGEGVLICVTDTGFKFDHEAMAGTDLITSYDFVDDDSVVSYEPGDPSASETHGTKVWSIIAGFDEGNLIGIATGASFILARTENYDEEYPGEEDHWIASAEWADSIGADIITLSLGYDDWYTPDSMNGDIAPISRAADRMAEIGMVVTAAAGNNGYGVTTITAPGDADSILTIGAVTSTGAVASFSSRGPTADGRTKPEICTLGMGTWCATSYGIDSYGTSYGTSAATPIAAGLAALMLQARPYLLPMEIREALMNTASNSASPNNDIGWGVPDIAAALSYPIAGQIELPLFRGWNFVSIPITSSLPADSAFPDRIGDVWKWNPDSLDYATATTIEPGESYFVFFGHDTIISISGAPLTSTSKTVEPGWNSIGGVRSNCYLPTMATASTAGLDIFLYNWNPIEQDYRQSKTLSPGSGAFLLVLEPGDINIIE